MHLIPNKTSHPNMQKPTPTPIPRSSPEQRKPSNEMVYFQNTNSTFLAQRNTGGNEKQNASCMPIQYSRLFHPSCLLMPL
ncbi:hypothetical protein BDZ45DRAFT_69292 [Acephala macrosclerotiorum]|nr:hypothetical protein BDZ45DRAFT_69292 [Acephala macrosclerotiorum]